MLVQGAQAILRGDTHPFSRWGRKLALTRGIKVAVIADRERNGGGLKWNGSCLHEALAQAQQGICGPHFELLKVAPLFINTEDHDRRRCLFLIPNEPPELTARHGNF